MLEQQEKARVTKDVWNKQVKEETEIGLNEDALNQAKWKN